MSDLHLLEILVGLAAILLVVGIFRLHDAYKARKFSDLMEDALEQNPGPQLTEAEIKEFHAMRWDGD